MNVQRRIHTIKLAQKLYENPEYAKRLQVSFVMHEMGKNIRNEKINKGKQN